MNVINFYVGDRLSLFIDFWSTSDNDFLDSGLKLMNTKEGVQLMLHLSNSSSGSLKCHIFILSDAQLGIENREVQSVTC